MNLAQLTRIMPASPHAATRYVDWLNKAMEEFEINTLERRAYWLANVGHESGYLGAVEENLNYGAAGLVATWPSRFDAKTAAAYSRQPERIANRVYANRMGNRDESSGDGWRYRGAGLIQLTGADNHRAAAQHFKIPFEQISDWLKTPEGACRSAGWFVWENGLRTYADRKDFDGYCDFINRGRKTAAIGDSIGYADRVKLRDAALRVLA